MEDIDKDIEAKKKSKLYYSIYLTKFTIVDHKVNNNRPRFQSSTIDN